MNECEKAYREWVKTAPAFTVTGDIWKDAWAARDAEIQQLEARNAELERDVIEEIKNRDYWEGKATELAEDAGKALGFEVGEHSSANCPVQNAIDGIFEMREQLAEALTAGEVD